MTFTVTYRAKDGALREERIEAARRRFPQTIPGNRQRIEEGRNTIFTNAAGRLLVRFAEPGRAHSGWRASFGVAGLCARKSQAGLRARATSPQRKL